VSSGTPNRNGGGLSLQTLAISACASVAAAIVVPLIWAAGTLFAAAVTPVVVALVSEALRRPVHTIRRVAPRVVRRTPPAAPAERHFEPLDPMTPEGGVSRDDPYGLRRAHRRPRWKVALITGVLAFVIAAAAVTASELTVFGGAVSGEKSRTSLWGGAPAKPSASPSPSPAATASPAASATPSPSPVPTVTPTVTITPSVTPTIPAPSPTP
jgi:hypothetical protein